MVDDSPSKIDLPPLSRRDALKAAIVYGAGTAALVATGIPQEITRGSELNEQEPTEPQGDMLFVHQEFSNPQGDFIFSWNIQTGERRDVYATKDESFSSVSVSPDNSKIAFASSQKGNPNTGAAGWALGIRVVDVKTGAVDLSIDDKVVRGINWSNDGKNLIYASEKVPAKEETTIHIYSLDSKTDIKEVTLDMAIDDFSVNPQNDNIIAVYTNPNQSPKVKVIDISGDPPKTLTEFNSLGNAEWSPDGTKLAYWQDRPPLNTPTGISDVYVRDVQTGKDILVVEGAESPTWSPDGRNIAFAKYIKENVAEKLIDTYLPNGNFKRAARRIVDASSVRLARLDLQSGNIIAIGKDPLTAEGAPPYPYKWIDNDWIISSQGSPGIVGDRAMMVNKNTGKPKQVFEGFNNDFPQTWVPASK